MRSTGLFFFALLLGSTTSQYVEYSRVQPAESQVGDEFGYAIAIFGTTVAVGAPGYNGNAGAVFLFEQNETDKTFYQSEIVLEPGEAASGEAGERFGQSITMTNDTIVVGAPLADESIEDQGSVYIFKLAGDMWSQTGKLTSITGQNAEETQYGISVDLASDSSLLIVGAWQDSQIKTNRGSAYIYAASGDTYELDQKIELPNESGDAGEGLEQDFFGRSVAIEDDAALVGAHLKDVNGTVSQGVVYLFQNNNDTWEMMSNITADDGAQDDHFGNSMDLDGTRVTISSDFDNNPVRDEGSVYVYTRAVTALNIEDKLSASDAGEEDQFGFSLQMSGDKLVVGSPYANVDGEANAGTAYVYIDAYGTSDYVEYQKLIPKEGPLQAESLGKSVAIDAESDYIAVGAVPQNPSAGPGVAYIFGPDVYTDEPSSMPSNAPSSSPTQGFELCSPIYECTNHWDFWPFNVGNFVYLHRFNGPTTDRAATSCETKCFPERVAPRKIRNGWECGTCIF
jgi:hypothetical protein